MALGDYPVVSLAQARERYFAARKKLVVGIDPMAERKAEVETREREAKTRQREAENSFENIARNGGLWANHLVMLITSCGAYKLMFCQLSVTSSLTL